MLERVGVEAFENEQRQREGLLREMLSEFNEGRSKTFYSIAVTVLSIAELRSAIESAREQACSRSITDLREKSKLLHTQLDAIASAHSCRLSLRK